MSWFAKIARWSKAFGPHGAAALGGVLATIVLTWPLAWRSGDHILAAIYHWDAYTNAMIMGGRVDAALGRGPLSLYDDYFFAPLPNTIAFNENLFGLSLLFAPFYLASGNPLWAYNLTLLSSMALSVFFGYLFVNRLTHDRLAAFLAGVAFAFCPYVMFEVGRIQLAATQWIPACFLFLHRAMESNRRRDVVGLWVCYLLQIGTCLYYAMFLVPLLAATAVALFIRNRTSVAQLVRLGTGGLAAGGVALAIVYPYFASRKHFALERTLSFASSYDGKLGFFANVHPTNLTWTALHHLGEYRGAHEEIAFPGLTMALLALIAMAVPVARFARTSGLAALAARFAAGGLFLGAVVMGMLLSRSMLVGLFAGVILLVFLSRRVNGAVRITDLGIYSVVLVLSVSMFLGLEPLQFRGSPVHGLYYYFHTYFPGFNGIRKVSRQAVMTTFTLVVVAAFGSAWLFSRVRRSWARRTAFVALLAAVVMELRTFPHPLRSVWAGETVPGAYAFMARLPERDLVASFPQHEGVGSFRGDHGLALHNYLMLYHKHRSLNGQSSWEPTVTNLVNRALAHLPDDGARRILQSVGMRHLLIHGSELSAHHRRLPERLKERPSQYRLAYQDGNDYVFSLLPDPDPSLELALTPALPGGAVPVERTLLTAVTKQRPEDAWAAMDGRSDTWWSTRTAQAQGQEFGVRLAQARPIVALEIRNPLLLNDVPLAYEIAVANGAENWRVVARRPEIRVPHELVYSPKNFVFREVFAEPILADRLRLTVARPVPGAAFSIQELVLYEQPPP